MTDGEAVAAPQPARGAAAGPGPASGPGGISRWTDIGGPVHYLDFGGPAGAPVIVAVHGLDGCAVNWSALAPLLTSRYRVLAPDLAGHGLTRAARPEHRRTAPTGPCCMASSRRWRAAR